MIQSPEVGLKRLFVFLLWTPLLAGGVAPNRYIVELTGESAGHYITRTVPANGRRAALQGESGRRVKATVAVQQSTMRARLERNGARVVGSLDTVANVLFVNVPSGRIDRLRRLAGVQRILPERTYRLTLDHAAPLHKIPEAWSLGGAYPQGQGVKIGMIDTGIDITHPGFKDAGFQAPAGFPKTGAASDSKFTNNKIIVARSYVQQCLSTDPDTSAQDDVGHGTGTAMAAAGVQNTGSMGTITGAAPQAYLGNYKVFGSPGVNDEANSCAIDRAVEDAVNDGMDVVNLSLGGAPAPRTGDDIEVEAMETAVSLGVIVVISSGNSGPNANTMGSPGTSPSAISVGAMNNDRYFAAPFSVGSNGPYPAVPAAETPPARPITAPLVDISLSQDTTGLACSPLAANSLTGSIALILRGTCYFSVKLNNAQAAGAVAALVYTYESSPDAITMDVGSATLPAEMVSYPDGLTIKGLVTKPSPATMSFSQAPFSIDPNSIAGFSSKGPSVDSSIKPELLAVGENFLTAAETVNTAGELYSPTGYVVSQGTSFSAPLVAGAAAVLKAARPGYTPLEYKSMLVNSAAMAFPAPDQAQDVQAAGAGMMDLSAAVRATLAVTPSTLSFGTVAGTGQIAASIRFSNLGYVNDQFAITVQPGGSGPAPVPASTSVTLASNTFADVGLTFNVSGLAAGAYEGFIVIRSTASGLVTRVPYWYGVPSPAPAHITVLSVPGAPPAPSALVRDAIEFRLTDGAGIIVSGVTPQVTATAGGGKVLEVLSQDDFFPGVWSATLTMGPVAGNNTFHIVAGSLSQDITIVTQ